MDAADEDNDKKNDDDFDCIFNVYVCERPPYGLIDRMMMCDK
jgi:hypothetical protein